MDVPSTRYIHLAALVAVGLLGMLAGSVRTASASGSGEVFHYIGPYPDITCTNVIFPQPNWFNSRYGMLNYFSAEWANNLASTNHLFYVGYVHTGQVDVAGTAPGYYYSNMYVGGSALNPHDNTTTVGGGTYYKVERYNLYFGKCPKTKLEQSLCPKFVVIDSRGSGSSGISPSGQKFVDALRAMVGKAKVQVKQNPYEAVGVVSSVKEVLSDLSLNPFTIGEKVKAIGEALNGLGALVRNKEIGAYHASVLQGEAKLAKMIDDFSGSPCEVHGTKLILVGYSQGAQVTGDAYQSLGPANEQLVAGVVLFGDPNYNPNDSSDMFGLNDPNPRDRWTRNQGILGKRGAFNSPNVMSFCHRGDPVCQGFGQWLHIRAHMNYTEYGGPTMAARYFGQR